MNKRVTMEQQVKRGATAKVSKEDIAKVKEIEHIFYRLFNCNDGERVLKHLSERYLDRPVFNHSIQGDAQATYAAARSAEAELVKGLIKLSKPTKEGKL